VVAGDIGDIGDIELSDNNYGKLVFITLTTSIRYETFSL
jgi:hypothetical protein